MSKIRNISSIVTIITTIILTVIAINATALTVTNDSTHYTITANNYWEMKIKIENGCIWSFKDLTDSGYNSGHFNYMGQDGYNYKRSLLGFNGRNTEHGFMNSKSAIPASGNITYETAIDNSYFKLTYTETNDGIAGEYLYGGNYDINTSNGCVLTTIIVTINNPTTDSTIIDWSVSNDGQKTSNDLISAKYFLEGNVGQYSFFADGRNQNGNSAGDGEGINIIRTIAEDEEWAEATVADTPLNTLTNGLVGGRTFRLERLTGGAGGDYTVYGYGRLSYNAGNTWTTFIPATAPVGQTSPLWWAGCDGIMLKDAGGYGNVPGNFIKSQTGKLTINITTPPGGCFLSIR